MLISSSQRRTCLPENACSTKSWRVQNFILELLIAMGNLKNKGEVFGQISAIDIQKAAEFKQHNQDKTMRHCCSPRKTYAATSHKCECISRRILHSAQSDFFANAAFSSCSCKKSFGYVCCFKQSKQTRSLSNVLLKGFVYHDIKLKVHSRLSPRPAGVQ
jgi:hypothetical protein